MDIGRRRQGPAPGHGSGVSIGGDNNAPVQNVVGHGISHVRQTASVEGRIGTEVLRDLISSFRADLERHEAVLDNVTILRTMADTVESSLTNPDIQTGALQRIARSLPALVTGTVVEQAGQALSHALTAWLA